MLPDAIKHLHRPKQRTSLSCGKGHVLITSVDNVGHPAMGDVVWRACCCATYSLVPCCLWFYEVGHGSDMKFYKTVLCVKMCQPSWERETERGREIKEINKYTHSPSFPSFLAPFPLACTLSLSSFFPFFLPPSLLLPAFPPYFLPILSPSVLPSFPPFLPLSPLQFLPPSLPISKHRLIYTTAGTYVQKYILIINILKWKHDYF